MRIGVPGEFHEDRWQRTAEDSERRVIPRTREASGPSDTSYRVAKRASIGTSARGPSTEALLGQGRVPRGRESVPLQGLWSSLRPGLARHPRLQVVQRHGRVAKRGFYQHFGTATLPAGTSELSPRGERPADRSMTSHLPITNRCSDRSLAGLSNR